MSKILTDIDEVSTHASYDPPLARTCTKLRNIFTRWNFVRVFRSMTDVSAVDSPRLYGPFRDVQPGVAVAREE